MSFNHRSWNVKRSCSNKDSSKTVPSQILLQKSVQPLLPWVLVAVPLPRRRPRFQGCQSTTPSCTCCRQISGPLLTWPTKRLSATSLLKVTFCSKVQSIRVGHTLVYRLSMYHTLGPLVTRDLRTGSNWSSRFDRVKPIRLRRILPKLLNIDYRTHGWKDWNAIYLYVQFVSLFPSKKDIEKYGNVREIEASMTKSASLKSALHVSNYIFIILVK